MISSRFHYLIKQLIELMETLIMKGCDKGYRETAR